MRYEVRDGVVREWHDPHIHYQVFRGQSFDLTEHFEMPVVHMKEPEAEHNVESARLELLHRLEQITTDELVLGSVNPTRLKCLLGFSH